MYNCTNTSRQIFEIYSSIKFRQNPSSGSRVVPCWRTDGHDKASSRFSKLRSNYLVVRVLSVALSSEAGGSLPCLSCAVLPRVQRNEIQVLWSCKSTVRKSHTALPTPTVNIRWEARRRVVTANDSRQTQKVVTIRHLVTENYTACRCLP
jgi:hypothetical protein